MKRVIFYVILLVFPIVNNAGITEFDSSKIEKMDVYANLKLADLGLDSKVFNLALKGLHKLELNGRLKNASIITIVDYSQSSNKKRLYVIDLKNNIVLFNSYVAHGRNSGEEYATLFSNVEGSLQSSLGFYITQQPVIGSTTGFALMINGVEKGFNDNAVKRSIIIHAAEYATESFIKKYGRLGRSYGCPSLPPEVNKPIIETIKNGTCLFIFNPEDRYNKNSTLIN